VAQETLVFDMYGTLVNVIGIQQHLQQWIRDDAERVSRLWRQKQLEYTFLLTLLGRYEDFEQVTRKALDYALLATGHTLSDEHKVQLMARYNDLEPFPDVHEGLKTLQQKKYPLIVFSNGTPTMLRALMKSAQLEAVMEGFISADSARAYKPTRQVYQLTSTHTGRPLHEIRLISSNPFDIIGAMNAGMQATWIDRSGGIFDTLGEPPPMVVKTLVELAEKL
jgi:2-haloacid dehalogenase